MRVTFKKKYKHMKLIVKSSNRLYVSPKCPGMDFGSIELYKIRITSTNQLWSSCYPLFLNRCDFFVPINKVLAMFPKLKKLRMVYEDDILYERVSNSWYSNNLLLNHVENIEDVEFEYASVQKDICFSKTYYIISKNINFLPNLKNLKIPINVYILKKDPGFLKNTDLPVVKVYCEWSSLRDFNFFLL